METAHVIDLVLGILLLFALTSLIFLYTKRLFILVSSVILNIMMIVALEYNMSIMFYFSLIFYIVLLVSIIFVNLGALRNLIVRSPKFKFEFLNAKKVKPKKIFDRSAMCKVIEDTVIALSNSKTGAIITFQGNDDLKNFMRNGVKINCLITKELLLTIFYPGTRLHDGSVIIKDNLIVSASVYYALTTRPLKGKYGSRHRAAIGISEVSDSITVVVSEETGRISIAQNGTIESVAPENFLRVFQDLYDRI